MHTIKRLSAIHRDKLIAHFLRLDETSRYSRFCSHIKDDSLKNYVMQMDFKHDGIFGLFNEQLDIIGVGECVFSIKPDENGKYQAEVGFSVEPQFQGQGFGNKLMKRVIQFAHANGTEVLIMYCLSTNQKSMHLAKKYGLKTQTSYGETKAIIDMPDVSPLNSQYQENMDEMLAHLELSALQNQHMWKNHLEQMGQWMNPQTLINYKR